MTIPNNQPVRQAERDKLPELRANIGEAMESATLYMNLAQDFMALGDDKGTAYALRQSVAYFRFGIGTFNQLADIRTRLEQSGGA